MQLGLVIYIGRNNMALTRDESLSLYGTEAYTAWPEEGAQQDWIATDGSKGMQAGGGGGYEDIFAMLGLGGGGGGGGGSSVQTPGNWGNFLFNTKIRENNPQVEQYARNNGLSYEMAALQLYNRGEVGEDWPEFPRQTGAEGGQPFSFDWEQAEKDALEKLRPYYEEKLAEAEGDVNLAKQRIEEDYQQGRRFREEDIGVEKEGWAMGEPRELNELLENLNKRGVLQSTIRTGEEEYLGDTQRRRREAVERTLRRREEIAGLEKGRGVEDIERQFPRFKREMEEEKKQRALELAGTEQQKGYQRYTAEAQRFV